MLIPCPICQRQVSEAASCCPGCGHPLAAAEPDASLPPAAETSKAELEAAGAEVLAAAEVPGDTEATTGAEPAAEGAPRLSGLSPDPRPTPQPGNSDQTPDVPGSFPAAMLLLTVFGLGLIERIAAVTTGSRSPGGVNCVTLIIAIGLLRGGSGFRTWGVLSSSFGLLIWPLLLFTGVFGPAGLGNYLGLIFNIGILLLLAGEPSRTRVRAGVAVAVLGIVASGVVTAVVAPAETPVASGQFVPAGTHVPVVVPYHEPQEVTLPKELGRLSLTVPSDLPEIEPEPPGDAPLDELVAANRFFSGEQGSRGAGVNAFRLKPGRICDLQTIAHQITTTKNVSVLSRVDGTLGGMPSVRIVCQVTESDGTESFGRYECVAAGPYYYTLYVADSEQSFVQGEAADAFFNSGRCPEK